MADASSVLGADLRRSGSFELLLSQTESIIIIIIIIIMERKKNIIHKDIDEKRTANCKLN